MVKATARQAKALILKWVAISWGFAHYLKSMSESGIEMVSKDLVSTIGTEFGLIQSIYSLLD